ncbi:MAG: quinoprotein relay system zinc metallohydrolase 1 [Actinomycetota bacterium]
MRFLSALAFSIALPAVGADFDYRLQPRQIANDTWVVQGADADFSPENGGNIVNTAFVVTDAGVVVIDSGPSKRYGEQLRAAIARITPRPIAKVLITHFHPDHFLGSQAFPAERLCTLPGIAEGIRAEGENFNANLYRLAGDWMLGTEAVIPACTVAAGQFQVGGHRFELLALDGHTAADLAVFDTTTGVLFAGDLVFHGRAPTTPHANLPHWLAALDRLAAQPFRVLVPGHGAPTRDDGPIRETRDWLAWLGAAVAEGAARGFDLTDMLNQPLPARFRSLAVATGEFRRSLSHLFPAAERAVLEHRP